MFSAVLDWILHLDAHLLELFADHGVWAYFAVFATIFAETGLVIAPFLPGDSLLFVCGALAANGTPSLAVILVLLTIAAIAGDAVNFAVGASVRGDRSKGRTRRWPNPKHLKATEEFFQRHGGKAIVLARFVPVVRTLAPFVAGLGSMPYRRFLVYNVTGALLWVVSVTVAGYLFGNIGWVKDNFTLFLLGIVIVSVVPAVVGWLRERKRAPGRSNAGR